MLAGTESSRVAWVPETEEEDGEAQARADCSSAWACGAKPGCALTTFTQGA
jgi:hypothetical protein